MLHTLIDIGVSGHVKNAALSRMIAELSPYCTEMEIDALVGLLNSLGNSQYDVNCSPEDAARMIAMTIGRERYEAAKISWARKNQKLIRQFDQYGVRKKYVHKATGKAWDGLDVDDRPEDYEVIYA